MAEASTRKFETSYKHFTLDVNPPSVGDANNVVNQLLRPMEAIEFT